MATTTGPSRAALLFLLGVLGAVPVASGAAGVLVGPGALPGGRPVDATTDSEYRYANAWWLAAGPGLWWSLRRPAERRDVTRILLAVAAAGGLGRLLAWRRSGRPHPVLLGALGLELVVVPLLLLWHAREFGGRT